MCFIVDGFMLLPNGNLSVQANGCFFYIYIKACTDQKGVSAAKRHFLPMMLVFVGVFVRDTQTRHQTVAANICPVEYLCYGGHSIAKSKIIAIARIVSVNAVYV